MTGPLPVIIGFAVGVAATAWTIWAWRWKADRADHRLARWYHHYYRLAGWPYTNAAATVPVMGAWGYLVAISVLVTELAPGVAADITWVAWVIGSVLVVMSGWALFRPAVWMEPSWLREARWRDKAGLPSNVPVPPEGDRPVMSRRAFSLTIAGYVVFAAVWWYLELPMQYLLLGFAAGIPILLATRVKK